MAKSRLARRGGYDARYQASLRIAREAYERLNGYAPDDAGVYVVVNERGRPCADVARMYLERMRDSG